MVLKEYEDVVVPGTPAAQINRNMANEIEQDILMSAAVFVILTETVQHLPHTWSWIVWECGQAKAKQKPVWIFEPFNSFGKVQINIPAFDHYVRFEVNDEWRKYIHVIARSHRDTPALLTSSGAVSGAVLSGGLLGAIIGGGIGYLLSNASSAPQGFGFTCDRCFASYEVHIPSGTGHFRCVNCNKQWLIA